MATYYDLKPSYKDSSGDIHTIPTYAVDSVLNTASTNAISNATVATALQGLQTATGNPVTISNSAPINAQNVRVAIEAVQDLNGYDKPWAGGAGKNKLAPFTSSVTSKGITITPQSDGSVILNGTKTEDSDAIKISEWLYIKDNTYTVSIGTYPSTIADYGFSGYGRQKTVTRGTTEFATTVQVYINQGTTVDNVVLYPQIELGETATDYEPYSNVCPISGWDALRLNVSGEDTSNPTTYTKSLSTTNFGGYWDATEGVIGTTHACYTITGTETTWRALGLGFGCSIGTAIGAVGYNRNAISNMYKRTSLNGWSTLEEGEFLIADGYVGIRDSAHFTTKDEAKAFFAGLSTPCQILAKYTTPPTATTTPEQIPLSQGTNNLWSDTGDVTIKFWPNNIVGQLVGLIQQSQS